MRIITKEPNVGGDANISIFPIISSTFKLSVVFPHFTSWPESTHPIFLLTYYQQATTLEQNQNTNQWPHELDALIASPQHHKLLYENEFVRVLDTNIPPGEATNLQPQAIGSLP